MLRYNVVIVRCASTTQLRSWRTEPKELVDDSLAISGVARWAGLAWIKAFNEAEQAQPCGVWAVLRRQLPDRRS